MRARDSAVDPGPGGSTLGATGTVTAVDGTDDPEPGMGSDPVWPDDFAGSDEVDVVGSDEVRAANRAYYEAFEAADIDAMSAVWEHSDRVLCTHPGWAALRGWAAIAASYFALFRNGQSLQFILTDEHVEVAGDTAWVSVDENILGEDAGSTAAAVNLFVRNGDGWRMVLHHSSQVVT